MNDVDAQIAALQAEIAQLEIEVTELQANVLDIERELEAFTQRFDRLVKPKAERLEIIKKLVADLEQEQAQPASSAHNAEDTMNAWQPPGYVPVEEQFRRAWTVPEDVEEPKQTLKSDWQPPPDYVPVEEQFRRAWNRPRPAKSPLSHADTALPPLNPNDPLTLKQLYRRLARRYHPDLTTNPDERERRNRLMAEINEAYSQRDMDTLRALYGQPADATPEQPLATIRVNQLHQIRQQLVRRIEHLKRQRHTLINSEMMEFKLRATLSAREGGDLLREMADDLERQYVSYLDRLDALRRS